MEKELMMDKVVIYWAAPLFSQAERVWNRLCADFLETKGYEVILPQERANAYIKEGIIDFKGLVNNCYLLALRCDIMIAVLDGPDTDSGTSLECGLRIGAKAGKIIGVRTDFRKAEDGQLNAMFRLLDHIIYQSSIDESVAILCDKIDNKIMELLK